MSRVRIGHNSGEGFVEDQSLSRQGYEFQFRIMEQIVRRLEGFETVTLRRMDGSVISRETLRRYGRDGGLDFIVEIETATEAAATRVANLVRKVLDSVGSA